MYIGSRCQHRVATRHRYYCKVVRDEDYFQFGLRNLSAVLHEKNVEGSFKPVFDFRINRFEPIRLDE